MNDLARQVFGDGEVVLAEDREIRVRTGCQPSPVVSSKLSQRCPPGSSPALAPLDIRCRPRRGSRRSVVLIAVGFFIRARGFRKPGLHPSRRNGEAVARHRRRTVHGRAKPGWQPSPSGRCSPTRRSCHQTPDQHVIWLDDLDRFLTSGSVTGTRQVGRRGDRTFASNHPALFRDLRQRADRSASAAELRTATLSTLPSRITAEVDSRPFPQLNRSRGHRCQPISSAGTVKLEGHQLR
ncbi:MAG: hypothetical protein QOI78_1642 [Actinomycetota bacterium]|nr:hypothetical protein [Actinomycetota bacterium]